MHAMNRYVRVRLAMFDLLHGGILHTRWQDYRMRFGVSTVIGNPGGGRVIRGRQPGFSLIECCVVMVVVMVLVSLASVGVSKAKEASRELVCSNNLRRVGDAVLLYAAEYQDRAPAFLPARSVVTPSAERWYAWSFHALGVLAYPQFTQHAGITREARSNGLLCPSNQIDWSSHEPPGFTPDYVMSVSAYTRPQSLARTSAVPARPSEFMGEVQQLSSVAFPSLKVMAFEWWVWHGWRGSYTNRDGDLGRLSYRDRPRRPGFAWCIDGHVQTRKGEEVREWFDFLPWWVSGPFHTTRLGVKGVD